MRIAEARKLKPGDAVNIFEKGVWRTGTVMRKQDRGKQVWVEVIVEGTSVPLKLTRRECSVYSPPVVPQVRKRHNLTIR